MFKTCIYQILFGLPICLSSRPNFEFGNGNEAIWHAKSGMGSIEILDMSPASRKFLSCKYICLTTPCKSPLRWPSYRGAMDAIASVNF